MTCPQPNICGPESRRGCWVCEPDDDPADQDQLAQENYYEMRDETL